MTLYKSLNDEDLILLLKQGNHAAFTEIYKRYAVLIYYHVNKMLQDEDASQDLVQELFITIWDKANNIKADANLAGYLYIAAKNRVLKIIQNSHLKQSYLDSLQHFVSEVNYDTLDRLQEKDLQAIIEHEIKCLPNKMRIIFELSRKDNLTHQQIADKLGISPETVKKQVQNAIRILKPKINFVLLWSILYLLLKKD